MDKSPQKRRGRTARPVRGRRRELPRRELPRLDIPLTAEEWKLLDAAVATTDKSRTAYARDAILRAAKRAITASR